MILEVNGSGSGGTLPSIYDQLILYPHTDTFLGDEGEGMETCGEMKKSCPANKKAWKDCIWNMCPCCLSIRSDSDNEEEEEEKSTISRVILIDHHHSQ